MVCSIDDIVSRRPGKHTRFPTVYLVLYLLYFFNRTQSISRTRSLSLSFSLSLSLTHTLSLSFTARG